MNEARLPGKTTRSEMRPRKEAGLFAAVATLWLPVLLFSLCVCAPLRAQSQMGMQQQKGSKNSTPTGMTPQGGQGAGKVFLSPETRLQTGIRLTKQGRFTEAIPYLLAASGHVAAGEEFAADFDLSLCYFGTGQYQKAVPILLTLRKQNPGMVNVENLLTQSYIGARQPKQALDALRRAATIDPRDERLYLFATDACTESGSYDLGLKVADLGLTQLPHSARLHYQRGMFLAHLDRADLATKEYHLAAKYAAGQTIAYMGEAQAALLNGDMPGAIKAARRGLHNSPANYVLLAILGRALVRSGASPGQPEFTEALRAMEKAVAAQPNHAGSQVTLGNLYLMAGKLDLAIKHLEKARELSPRDMSVYAHLANAYRRHGNMKKAREMLETLARLNQQKAATYRTGPSNERRGYLSGGMAKQPPDIPHRR
jgi:tetratricopeptide (TPR) repeat protein